MKTAKLVKLLQEADPSGELEVSVGNCDITYVDVLPGYYDGTQQIFERNAEDRIVGARYNRGQPKVQINYSSISDMLWDYPHFHVDYTELPYGGDIKKEHAKIRKESQEIEDKVEREHFIRYICRKYKDIADLYYHQYIIESFHRQHYSGNAPIPPDLRDWSKGSWNDRREIQWDREVKCELVDKKLVLTKIQS